MSAAIQELSNAEAKSYWESRPAWKESSLGRIAVEVLGDKAALAGGVWIALMFLLAIVGPALPLQDPEKVDIAMRFQPPSLQHLFGTDDMGRDIFTRTILAARISVLGSMAAVAVGTFFGVPWGLTAGFFGGRVDAVMMRIIDFMLSIPTILLALLIVAMLGPGSLNAIIAIAVTRVPTLARLARSSTMVEIERDYVLASRSIGASNRHMLFKVILPNCLAPIFVQVTLSLAFAILLESGLSFLGLGTRPPTPAWGYMLSMGRRFLREAPWFAIFPGLTITLFVLAVGFVSDGLRAGIGARTHR
jgi:ABC-type dipeptide/oligopeptide/nickel transport system permease subunit